ncbi:hypothetical protein KUCAC02_011318, partial [Chaenocephalus aceratus]
LTRTCINRQLERKHTAAKGYGKQLKKYFVAGLKPKGINYKSLLGTVFLVRSVGPSEKRPPGALYCSDSVLPFTEEHVCH